MPAKKKKQTKLSKLGKFIKPTSPVKGMLVFAVVFAVIGGSYAAYKSFAATPITIISGHRYTRVGSAFGVTAYACKIYFSGYGGGYTVKNMFVKSTSTPKYYYEAGIDKNPSRTNLTSVNVGLPKNNWLGNYAEIDQNVSTYLKYFEMIGVSTNYGGSPGTAWSIGASIPTVNGYPNLTWSQISNC